MNTNPTSQVSEQVWKFLHGEMDPAEKAAFELRVREDAKLESELRAQRSLHRLLVHTARADFADRLLQEYLAEQQAAAPAKAPPAKRRLHFPGRNALLALAASVVVVAGLLWMNLSSRPLRWEAPRVIATAYRAGHPVPPPGKYEPEALLVAARDVMAQVDTSARARHDARLTGLRETPLRMSVEEIFAGQISLTVEVPGRDAWTGNFASLDALRRKVPGIAEDIVDHLQGRPARPAAQ